MDSVWLWYPKKVPKNAKNASPFTTPADLFLIPTSKFLSRLLAFPKQLAFRTGQP